MGVLNWGQLIEDSGGAASYEAIPDGPYNVVVDSAQAKVASSGNTMFVAQLRVQDGPHKGRVVFNNFVVVPSNPNALGMFFRNMAALGLDAKFFAANPPEETVASALVGRACRVDVGRRTWQGQVKNEVKKVMPPTGGVTGVVAPSAPGVPQLPSPQVPTAQEAAAPAEPHPVFTPAPTSTPVAEAPTPAAENTPPRPPF